MIKDLIDLLGEISRDRFAIDAILGKILCYIAFYIFMLGSFICLFAWILR